MISGIPAKHKGTTRGVPERISGKNLRKIPGEILEVMLGKMLGIFFLSNPGKRH